MGNLTPPSKIAIKGKKILHESATEEQYHPHDNK